MNNKLFYNQLYTWFEQNRRILPWRETENPYYIWLSEIILQQTRVEQGLPYYLRFVERFPDIKSLASATEDEVLLLWQGLGYYSRARHLHQAAKMVVERGQIPFPTTFDTIHALPGIGDYTAGAIAAFAYNMPYPALDGNVYRVLARLYDCEMAFDTASGKKHFHQLACDLLDSNNARLFDSAIMEFGALFCTPLSPDCEQCPIQTFCQAYAHHTVDLLPIRKPRPKVKERYFNYSIYIAHGQTIIQQRMKQDIWQHLWEFPIEETEKQQDNPTAPHIDFTHLLSHQRIHARFLIYKVEQLPHIKNTRVVSLNELNDYAFSRLALRALEWLFNLPKPNQSAQYLPQSKGIQSALQ